MRILSLTAGAARMYCGSCLRDNALAAELVRQGHHVRLQPLYTPTRTDEPNVSEPVVFLNGISVCLDQQAAFFRRPHPLLDRLWDAGWMLKLAARTSIAVDPHQLGAMTVSMLRGEEGFQLREIRKFTEWLRGLDPPDIAVLPNSLLSGLAEPVRRALNRPVCCTFQGEELFLDQMPEPYRAQAWELVRANAASIDGFIAVSRYSAAYWMERLGISGAKMHVVPLGINVNGYPEGRAVHAPFRIGYLARIAPEKGLHVLAECYRRLLHESGFGPATLEAAGYLAPEHGGYLRAIEREMRGLEFRYHGELDRARKIEFLHGLDVFSVPAVYDEPKGISVLEAMAAGVPVVQPRRGAFVEILEQTGGGLLTDDLADGILRIRRDPALAAALSEAGARAVRERFTVAHMATSAAEAFAAIAALTAHA
ncbi:MAG: glycosyltransferase family 4 protein [Bryobacteraceae bacterium]